jgi:photosystem II stability/assembly factor-like uncharacterized protein
VEPHLAVSPTDPRHLIAVWQQDRRMTGGAVGTAAAASTDGGATWHAQRVPGGAPCGARGLTGASDPWVAIGPEGTAYLAALPFAAGRAKRPRRAEVAINRAAPTAGGAPGAWSAPTTLTAGRAFDDKPAVTADPRRPGVAYAVWHRGARTLLSRTRDTGVTWSDPRAVRSLRHAVGQVIVPLPGGRLLMTGLAFGRPRRPFVAVRSEDAGRTWGRRVRFGVRGPAVAHRKGDERLRTGGFPAVAVLPEGTIVAVWTAAGRRRSRLLRVVSRDGGRTWSPATVVLRRPGRMFTPELAAAPGGTLGVSWTEVAAGSAARRPLTTDAYFASSPDGGRTWRARRIAGPFDLRRAPRAGRARFLGDYTGLVAVRGGFGVLTAVAPPTAVRGRSDVVFVRVHVPTRDRARGREPGRAELRRPRRGRWPRTEAASGLNIRRAGRRERPGPPPGSGSRPAA